MDNEICIFIADSNGCFPVPASKGGAVSTLVELLVAGNNQKRLCNMTIVSYYDKHAFELSYKYPNIKFIWIKIPWVIRQIDRFIFWFISTYTRKKATSFKSLCSLIIYILKSTYLIKKNKYKTIILEHNIPMVWMIKLSGFKGKYFHHLHNLPRTNAKSIESFKRCSGFLCISEYMANYIMSKECPIGPVNHSKIKLLFNCIDTTLFRPITSADKLNRISNLEKFGIKKNSNVIIFAGRITWEKGVDKIIEAFEYINNKDVELLIVGSFMMDKSKDPFFKLIENLSRKNKERIHFTNYIEHKQLPILYNLADIAVLPSIWEEPAGLTMLEAMACGTPVITTYSGGIPEYVGDAAIVLERNNNLPLKIAQNIDMLLSNKKQYDFYSKKGSERVKNLFSSENYIDKFYNIISK